MSLRPVIAIAVICFALPAAGIAEPSAPAPGTVQMADILKNAVATSNPLANPYLNHEAALYYGEKIRELSEREGSVKVSELIGLFFNHAVQLLRSGQNREAIAAFERLDGFLESQGVQVFPEKLELLKHFKMLCYLRLGERENCLATHSSESCLLPIQGGGVHQLPEGSRKAIELLMARLNDRPGDRRSIWLLNLAHMTLGQYPNGVPAQWRIPEAAFQSDIPFPAFPEIGGRAGLDVNGLAGGCVVDDFDGDGDLDVMTSSWGVRDPLRYFERQADGRFVEKSGETGLQGITGGLNLLQADYNNDGKLDFLVLRGAWFGEEGRHPNSLIKNLGGGRFEDATVEAGLLSFHPTQTAAWADFNGDGRLDLYIGNESTDGSVHPCELYLNRGDGSFREAAAIAGADHQAYVKAVAAGDYDNDGRMDLYLSCRGQANVLYRNAGVQKDGVPRFVNEAESAGVTDPLHSFPAWFFDYNQDGWLDLFVAGYKIEDVGDIASDVMRMPHKGTNAKLYLNRGNGSFSDATKSAGLDRILHAMGANFGDLNSDGYPDIYLGTGDPNLSMIAPNRMFVNDQGSRFLDVTTAGRFGHLQKGHGISFADLDQDGDTDVYAVMGGAFSGDNYMNALFENPGFGHDWILVRLIGETCNRSAIGSRLRFRLKKGPAEREVFASVNSGGSFGASPLRQHVGFGSGWKLVKAEVQWAGSSEWTAIESLDKNKFYTVRQGKESEPELQPYPRLPFQSASGAANPTDHHHRHD